MVKPVYFSTTGLDIVKSGFSSNCIKQGVKGVCSEMKSGRIHQIISKCVPFIYIIYITSFPYTRVV
jgi:hypothetical protein